MSIPNRLYYGDNLPIMEEMSRDCVDLIYLDPPFNSNKNYNLMYRDMTGRPVSEQVEAFCDTWEMDAEKEDLARKMPMLMREQGIEDYYVEFWRLWINALRHTQPRLLAYLIYMVQRLMHMKIILKPTGSIYLHCDPTASHYIKVMMDAVFGHQNFRNEVIWKRTSAHSDAKRLGSVHDVILCYTASDKPIFNQQYQAYDKEYIERRYRYQDANGRRWMDGDLSAKGLSGDGYEYEYKGTTSLWRVPENRMKELDAEGRLHFTKRGGIRIKRYLDEMKGLPLNDVWSDISPINSQAKERMGYPTQKPIALLKRIVAMSSNEGDVVFDPFCGCGTTIYAAYEIERQWIGCDIAILATRLISKTLDDRYNLKEGKHFEVSGIPVTVEQAEDLFKRDPFQFQHWFVEHVEGFPSSRKTADRGVDGRIYFRIVGDELREILLSVKGGAIRPADIRDLRGALEREDNAEMAAFLSLREPTKAMREEAAAAGMYEYRGESYPRIQLLTVADVLEEKREVKSESKVRAGKNQLALPL